MDKQGIKETLASIRQSIIEERVSYGELAELEQLKEHIDKDDIELLQWAGVPEEGRPE
jgi:hypothetical protein